MERREKIRDLQNYMNLEKAILELNERYEELFIASTKITPSYSEGGFGGGFDSSKIEKNCIKLLEIDSKREKLIAKKLALDENIKSMTYLQRKIVWYVAVESHSIADASRYFRRSYNDVKSIYNRAIEKCILRTTELCSKI